ncbi:cytochrome P450 [Artomyces pyxidatus]|uniref:Cytochrome P450 n=1 Tax=Artomyces pyxidatus TaxID=48021 RepID=A0ACB8ST41_9AGAM|nr:cytochrome P450 [Artomyces pyxidatus]
MLADSSLWLHRSWSSTFVVTNLRKISGPPSVSLFTGGLGETFDSLDHHEEHKFAVAMQEYMPTISSLQFFRRLSYLARKWPRLLRFYADRLPSARVQNLLRVSDTMYRCPIAIFEEKRALLEKGDEEFAHQLSEGKDVISLLMRGNRDASEEMRLSDDEIISQIGTFLFAGAETTSTSLSRVFLLLAQHPEVQDRLRDEINKAHAASVDNAPEIRLRPFHQSNLRTGHSYPAVPPDPDGRRSAVLRLHTNGIAHRRPSINRDKDIWGADADEWKPERFLSPLPASVAEARIAGIYSNTMTFAAGGRACIGFKFGELEMKVVLAHLVRSFRFAPPRAEIVWKFGRIVTPSVKGSNAVGTNMPMVLERL